MSKIRYYISIITIMIATYGVFVIKNVVESLNNQLSLIQGQIKREKHNLHLLTAELAHLNNPTRLKNLARRYLKLEQVELKQIVSNPITDSGAISIENNDYIKKASTELKPSINWRYKNALIKCIAAKSYKNFNTK